MTRRGARRGEGRTELVVEGPGGERVVWGADVRVGREVLSPSCGVAMEEFVTKTEPQLVVEHLRAATSTGGREGPAAGALPASQCRCCLRLTVVPP